MHKVLSVIAVSMVSHDNILCRHKRKDKYQSFCRKGIFISLTVSMQLLEEMNIAKLKSLVTTCFFTFIFIPLYVMETRYMHSYIFSNTKLGYIWKVIISNHEVIMITFCKVIIIVINYIH